MKNLSKLALILPLVFASACGDDTEELCPAGQMRVGDDCVPIADAGPSDGGRADGSVDGGIIDVDAGSNGATISELLLDFGRQVVGEEQLREVTVTNPTAEAVVVRVGTISGESGLDFTMSASEPIGPSGLSLGAGETVTFTFAFEPRAEGARSASIVFDLCEEDCSVTLELQGEGVLDAISCAPTALDFGTVNPGACRPESIVCTNDSDYDATIESGSLRTGTSTAFSTAPGLSFPLTLTAGSSEPIEVFYCPTALGSDEGNLDLVVAHPDPQRGDIAVSLSGRAGGPDIACAPSAIDFGETALGANRTRFVVCSNEGNEALIISSFALAASSSTDFTLTTTAAGTLAPGGSVTLELVYAPSAVGPATGSLEIASNDRDAPIVAVGLSGVGATPNGCGLAFSQAALDFGGVALGASLELALVVTSTGTGDCTVNLVGLASGSDPAFSLTTPSGSSVLSPGQDLTVVVAFAPGAERAHAGQIEIETNDLALAYPIYISVFGQGLGGGYPISARPNAIDFGATQVACTNPAEETLRISNSGPPVTLTAQVDASGAGVFSVGGQASQTVALGTNASVELTLNFTPSAVGSFSSRLVLSAAGLVPLSVPLQGTAAANPRNVDTFTTAGEQVVDLLLVVDDSCSMTEEQTTLAQTASILIAAGDSFGADYHIAVTTTDPGDQPPAPAAGTLRGSPAVILPQSPSRVADLTAAINVGINGSPDEQGLFTAAQAVSDPALLAGPNAGFLRPNGELVVLILSDEPDFSPLPTQTYVDQMANRPIGLPNALRIYTITGGLLGCTSPNGTAEPGLDYVEAALLTGGFDRSICDPNYAATVAEIAERTFDPPNRRFTLTAAPAPGSIEVFVDGVLVPAQTGTVTAWGVDYASGTLVFSLDAIPSPQSTVRVEYDPFCIPSTCGDGAVQGTEECDDGDADDTDLCLSTCRDAVCGDGSVRAGSSEQCDDGNSIGGDGCSSVCIIEGCGNGVIDLGEECDDGPANSDIAPNACRTSCLNAACHDGVVDTGEQCDDGNTSNSDLCVAECVNASCGDGFVNVPVEQCDDGNAIDDDGCTNSCTLNVLSFTVTTVPGTALVPTAGTAITWGGANADDGFGTIAVGFPFSYLGTAVTNVYPNTNGLVAFGAGTTSFSNATIPDVAAPNGFIAWWWDDLHMGLAFAPSTVATTALTGVAPNRVRVITLLNVPRYGSLAGDQKLNVEIRLFEGTNVIEVHYGALTAGTVPTWSASAGWESPDGLVGNDVLGCGATCTTASWPTNTIYRYTP